VYDARNEDAMLSVPAFANLANRALNEKLIERTRQLARVSAQMTEHQERGNIMAEHMKSIRSDLVSAQKVAESKAKELKTEEHLGALAERAAGRARQDLSALDGREEEARAALASIQVQISKGTQQLESFKAMMNWKQSELEKWAALAKQKEEDRLALEQ
jgi:chromosome segregation ATPase